MEPSSPYTRLLVPKAVMSGWKGLTERAFDNQGNIYGVYKGSSYSFSNHYYKHELPWELNDTHGIGIVLLAGTETIRMLRNHNSIFKIKYSKTSSK